MRKLMLCTAVAALTAGAAAAQTAGTVTEQTQDGTVVTTTTTGGDQQMAQSMDMQSSGMFIAGGGPEMAIRASDFIGKALYATNAAAAAAAEGEVEGEAVVVTDPALGNRQATPSLGWSERMYADEAMLSTRDAWEQVGDVSDVILSQDGDVRAVLVDIGGFLGIGGRTVAINMDQLRIAPASEEAAAGAAEVTEEDGTTDLSEFILVVNADRATLENAPEFDGTVPDEAMVSTGFAPQATTQGGLGEGTGMVQEGTVAENAEVIVTEDAAEEMAENNTTLQGVGTTGENIVAGEPQDEAVVISDGGQPTVTDTAGVRREPLMAREGYMTADTGYITTEYLTGARVYDANDEWVGDIAELVLDSSGQVTQAVVDVGGFLGIGEKPVAIPLDQMEILRQESGEEVRAYVMMTEDQLEELPTYDR